MLRVVFNTIKKQVFLSLGIIITVAGAIISALIPPLILSEIIDTITGNNILSWSLILAYFGFTVLTSLLESAREGLLIVFGQKITHALRTRLMEKYTSLSSNELTKQEPGAIVSRFIGDVDTVENLFTSGIISMFADACKIISIFVMIWFKTKGLAIILLLLIPLVFAFTRAIQKKMLSAQIANRKAVSKASGFVPETLKNIRTVHVYGKEKYMADRYDNYITEGYKAVDRTNFYDSIYSPVILILNAIVVAVVMLLSASGNERVLMFFGMSAGTAVAVINYISQIFSPIEGLGMEIQTIQSAVAGAKRIDEFLELKEMPEKKEIGESSDQAMVSLENVTFAYEDNQPVLTNFNLSVKKGEQITLTGRTGVGKSTIFKLILGLYMPQQGIVLVDGKNPQNIPDKQKRSVFGYVEQSFHMVPGTIADQITLFSKDITIEDVRRATQMVGLDDEIMAMEYGYETPCTTGLLSQGQWQLMSIARAVVGNPRLLLLDEITANLDASTERRVLEAIDRAMQNRTVIEISHRGVDNRKMSLVQ